MLSVHVIETELRAMLQPHSSSQMPGPMVLETLPCALRRYKREDSQGLLLVLPDFTWSQGNPQIQVYV
jgi:hypothetical protein